jgi:DNA-binding transcriptional LysR family regulator
MSWDGIEEAVAIADAGSFIGGATLLDVSTSHVSRSIARLEERLGAVLFDRTTRRVRLTDTGRVFVEQGRRIIQEREELMSLVDGTSEPHGELKITCSITLGERFVVPILRRFAEAHPRISISIDLSNRLIDLVGEGFDLAIRTGEVADKRLVCRRIASRVSEVCAAPHYLKSFGTPQTIEELKGHECLVGTNATWHFLEDGRFRNFTPRGRWRCNSGAAVAEAAIAGMGICQLPSFYVRQPIALGLLVPLLPNFCATPEPISVVYPQRRHLLPKVRRLAEAFEAHLQREIDSA